MHAELFPKWSLFVDDAKFCDIILNELIFTAHYVFGWEIRKLCLRKK